MKLFSNKSLIIAPVAAWLWLLPAVSRAADFQETMDEMRSYKSVHGTAPSLEEYFQAIEGKGFTGMEQSKLLPVIIAQQEPLITLDDLIVLLETKRDSIRSFRCKYTVSSNPGVVCYYAFDGNKIVLHDGDPVAKTSYDGEFYRVVDSPISASIEARRSLSVFHRRDMPLCRAMLFNQKLVEVSNNTGDLVEFIKAGHFTVFEERKRIDDSDCVLVGSLAFGIYLDVERDFALKRLNSIHHEYTIDKDGIPVISGHSVESHADQLDFKDYGNGIWLPSTVRVVHQHGTETVTDVVEMEVNPEIPETEFSEIIPDQASVADMVRDLAYIYGERGSIDEMLGKATPRKSARIRWVLVANTVLLLFAVLFYSWSRFTTAKSDGS